MVRDAQVCENARRIEPALDPPVDAAIQFFGRKARPARRFPVVVDEIETVRDDVVRDAPRDGTHGISFLFGLAHSIVVDTKPEVMAA